MKFDRIPTRRKPARKTLYARLFSNAKPKRQRAAAAASHPYENEDSGHNISRSLTIIFAIHILAIGMIFIHKQYLSDRTPDPVVAGGSEVSTKSEAAVHSPPARNNDLPKLSDGDTPYMVRQGDNYARIAEKFGVEVSELRNMNVGADIRAGAVLRIPQSKRIIAEDPPEVAAIRNQPAFSDSERGLVEIVPPVDPPKALVVRPNVRQPDSPPSRNSSSGRTHVLKSGENIWRIASKYKVSQKDILSLNNIKDPTKLKIGQVIKLP